MERNEILTGLKQILADHAHRHACLAKVAGLIKESGNYRWVGLYDVDHVAGFVTNIVWSGPGAPEFPTFPITRGLTGSAISGRTTVNVGNVAADPRYLTAFETTKSEIIVPIFGAASQAVVGTIDVESELHNAFDAKAQSLLEDCAELLRPLWQGAR
jgi:L-methionine (R)-S-oxide reductase